MIASSGHALQLATLDEVRLLPFDVHVSEAGSLGVIEGIRTVPFAIARTFHIWAVPIGDRRGRHAHRLCHQLFVCVAGACRVVCCDGQHEREFILDAPDRALFVPSTIWSEQQYLLPNTVLLVLADRPYEADDYVRDWDVFLEFRGI